MGAGTGSGFVGSGVALGASAGVLLGLGVGVREGFLEDVFGFGFGFGVGEGSSPAGTVCISSRALRKSSFFSSSVSARASFVSEATRQIPAIKIMNRRTRGW